MDKIDGVFLTQLLQIDTPKGAVWHAMKNSDNGYNGFGEAYFSFINKGEIKGWKKHTKMTLNIVVPIGSVRFRLIDDKTNNQNEFVISSSNYQRLTIPPEIWVCFEGIEHSNMLLNIADIKHDPKESINKELGELPL